MMKKVLVSLLLVALVAGVASAELRAWYKFDETSGVAVADSSGNGFDTVVSGTTAPKWDADGAIGGSLQETGQWTAMRVDVPAAVFSTVNTQLTIAFWAQLTPTTAGGGFFTGNNTNGDEMIKAIPYPSGDAYYGVWRAGSTATNWWWGYSPAAAEEGEWHHFAVVYDQAVGKGLYFDGELVGSAAIAAGDSIANIDVLKLFTRTASDTQNAWDCFKGKMDEVMIFDHALTAEELRYIPEPTTIALLGFGALALIRRKK